MTTDISAFVAALQAEKDQGRTAAEAMSALVAMSQGMRGRGPLQLGAPALAAGLYQVYMDTDGITALDIAAILRNLGFDVNEIALALHDSYPSLAPLDTGTILLDPLVYPATPRPGLVAALVAAGYPSADSALAANILFPVAVTVQSNQRWQSSGFDVAGSQTTSIAYVSGRWTANPANGMCDGNGQGGLVARQYYTLPGALEGALVGRIGSKIFLVGNYMTVPADLSGALELCINDDLDGRYGAGVTDNQGSLVIQVSAKKP